MHTPPTALRRVAEGSNLPENVLLKGALMDELDGEEREVGERNEE